MINRPLLLASLLATGLLMAGASFAQAPAGSTGACKDGTYSTQPSKKGACRGHKGVKEWYASDDAAPAAKAPKASKAAKAAAAPAATAATASAPAAGSTGQCKDGTYTDTSTKKGACRGHKGVKEWYAADASPATKAAAPVAAPPPAAPAAAPAPVVAAAPAAAAAPASATARRPSQFTPPAEAAAGGGAGMVWANGSSQVYHCPGDKWYGKTKSGSYMSEADAKAKGLHPDHGKACTN
jgi:hypothetical protein